MKNELHIARIQCPCCPRKIVIDLRIFARYRRLMHIASLADSHMLNFLYPAQFKSHRLKLALDEMFGKPAHNAPAGTRRRTWKIYIIDLILSNANIRFYIKYIKERLKSGEQNG